MDDGGNKEDPKPQNELRPVLEMPEDGSFVRSNSKAVDKSPPLPTSQGKAQFNFDPNFLSTKNMILKK
jgi:hypothetical protein